MKEERNKSKFSVMRYGLEVWNNEKDKFRRWLLHSVPAMGDKRPVDLLSTEEGRMQVLDCLVRIDHGVYS